ncbi:MAG: hypothetical protein R3C53_23610 [Pirellulaceae bacterium]
MSGTISMQLTAMRNRHARCYGFRHRSTQGFRGTRAASFAPLGVICFVVLLGQGFVAQAEDYFLIIGGGYNPRGNQASLEANVLFFEQVLREEHKSPRTTAVFFADGYDDTADVQALKPETLPPGPLTKLLTSLHSRGGNSLNVEYRNHRIPNVAGPISPKHIESSVRRMAASLKTGDRLVVYATAHGEEAKGKNKHNTLISCWNGEKISALEFSRWLDEVPEQVPVILVMAQCYCGGFANTIFESVDEHEPLSEHLRCGFFAQQYDLAAAGCRPDIENDEEYSSFFWGAFAGRSRNGRPMPNVDCNADGKISFAEAHAQAVIASDTIDIPLRTSEVLLRRYSRIAGYEHRGMPKTDEPDDRVAAGDEERKRRAETEAKSLSPMLGSVEQLIDKSSPDVIRTVTEICKQLSIGTTADVSQVFERYSADSREFQNVRRSGWRGRRGRSSGRRELREEIGEKWPELANPSQWRTSELLASREQEVVFAEIQTLPSYDRVAKYLSDREENAAKLEQLELRDVKYQRLINTLEAIVLAQNLPLVADKQVVQRYQAMLAVEQQTLQ